MQVQLQVQRAHQSHGLGISSFFLLYSSSASTDSPISKCWTSLLSFLFIQVQLQHSPSARCWESLLSFFFIQVLLLLTHQSQSVGNLFFFYFFYSLFKLSFVQLTHQLQCVGNLFFLPLLYSSSASTGSPITKCWESLLSIFFIPVLLLLTHQSQSAGNLTDWSLQPADVLHLQLCCPFHVAGLRRTD